MQTQLEITIGGDRTTNTAIIIPSAEVNAETNKWLSELGNPTQTGTLLWEDGTPLLTVREELLTGKRKLFCRNGTLAKIWAGPLPEDNLHCELDNAVLI